ncbi:MAG: VOC family protein [Verrucomicrobiota bacterium]
MSEDKKHEEDRTPGRVCWNELMSTDVEASKKFYGELIGWTFEEMPMPGGMTYTSANSADGRPAAGFMQMSPDAEGMPTCWGSYITVESVAASVEKAKSLGANIVKDVTELPMGKFAFIADPQGGVIGLWEFGESEC